MAAVKREKLVELRARLNAGDRAGALAIVNTILAGQRRSVGPPLAPSSQVQCDHFACILPARTCLARQAALWPGKKAALYAYCASGECTQGKEYRSRATWDPLALWSKGRFSFYRKDSREQHAARKRLGLERRGPPSTEAEELVQIGQAGVNVRTRARKGT